MRRISAALAALAMLWAVSCASIDRHAGAASPQTARVVRVVDGDTVHVMIGGADESVRLIGIDTPETVHPTKPVGCYGPEASAFTKRLLPAGEAVEVAFDVDRTDRYGRTLAYLTRARDGLFVNLELVRLGYATVLTIPPNVAHADEFIRAQRRARAQGRGLWGACG